MPKSLMSLLEIYLNKFVYNESAEKRFARVSISLSRREKVSDLTDGLSFQSPLSHDIKNKLSMLLDSTSSHRELVQTA